MSEQSMKEQMPAPDRNIIFENVSKFYGDVLGVNRVNLSIPPGVTSLVGPNGAGKTTLMNLMNGLIRPSQGKVTVCGLTAEEPEEFFRMVGYCSQFDSFPKGVTGREFVNGALVLHGYGEAAAYSLTNEAIERVNLTSAADRKVAGYSKGMRQRIRLALAIAHRPTVLILDEPLNGLDPMARAESMALFEEIGKEGVHVVISSHILHEVDRFSDRVILLSSGYVVAEGEIHSVRMDVTDQPMQIMVRCSRPGWLASQLFMQDHVVEAKLHNDSGGVVVRTKDVDRFYLLLNEMVATGSIELEAVAPADDDASSIYEYLIGAQGASA